jgi:ElaA protein
VYDFLALRAEIFVVEQACAYLDPDGHDPEAWHLLVPLITSSIRVTRAA